MEQVLQEHMRYCLLIRDTVYALLEAYDNAGMADDETFGESRIRNLDGIRQVIMSAVVYAESTLEGVDKYLPCRDCGEPAYVDTLDDRPYCHRCVVRYGG